jgi:CheY-like chemotaxis protein
MTAHSLYGEMQNCYNAGMTGYVSKPFKPENLFSAIIESIEIQNTSKKRSNTIDDMITYTS